MLDRGENNAQMTLLKRSSGRQSSSANLMSKRKRNNHEDTESTNGEEFWVGFTSFFLVWFSMDKKYQDLKDQIKVHELRMPLDHDVKSIAEGKTDIRRLVFIEQNGIFSFGFFCDEYATSRNTYIAYLEYSGHGLNPVRVVFQAYAMYMAVIGNAKWNIQIWADPSEDGTSFIFKRNGGVSKGRTAEELKTMYTNFLQGVGFDGTQFKIPILFPPLPKFGKKESQEVIDKYEAFKVSTTKNLNELNMSFEKTLCYELKFKITTKGLPNYTQPVRNIPDTELIPCESFAKNQLLDFSSEDSAKRATNEIIQQFKGKRL